MDTSLCFDYIVVIDIIFEWWAIMLQKQFSGLI
jgi:hypothetical protein